VTTRDFLLAVLLGLLAGAFGILLMRGIALCESVLARTKMGSAFVPAERHVVGWLSESFALRRYTDALELRPREVLGD
jgi:H+/Cl- antiporter ClcA